MSPRKVSLVAALVRGRSVADALIILEQTPKRAAQPVAKAIASARSNAIMNHRLEEKSLQIDQLQVTAGPRLKRYRPVAMGRANPFQKRTSHVSVILTGVAKAKKKTVSKATTPAAAPAKEKKEEQ